MAWMQRVLPPALRKLPAVPYSFGVEPFGFGDGALGFKKTVGAPDFGEVPGGHCREEAQGRSFMPRRVKPGKILPAQPFDGVEQGSEGSVHGHARLSGEILCLSYNKRRQLASHSPQGREK